MDIETSSPKVAAKYVYSRFKQGKGAEITINNGAKMWFAPSSLFGSNSFGVFVSCSKGGGVVFDSPLKINRFACTRARFPSWAGKFVVTVLKELVLLAQNQEVKSDLTVVADATNISEKEND